MRILRSDYDHLMEHTRHLWDDVRGQRIFLSGATGFVGTWMLEAFVAANRALNLGAELVILTRDVAAFRARLPWLSDQTSVICHESNLRDFVAPQGRFTYVVHVASATPHLPDRERPLGVLDENVQASRRMLDFAAACEAKRFLFTSSGAVYGKVPAHIEVIPETYVGAPCTLTDSTGYGEGKRISELACASYGRIYGFDAVIARLFAFAGPYLPANVGFAVHDFVQDALAGRDIIVNGDGTTRRSYLYGADLATWLWTMLLRGQGGVAYNVGAQESVSMRELAEIVRDTIAPQCQVVIAGINSRGSVPSTYIPDITLARAELQLKPWIDLRTTLERTMHYYTAAKRNAISA